MAFDGFFCAAMANELSGNVTGYRVEKINCRGETAEFSLYGDKTKKYLLVSLSASANFITLNTSPRLPNDIPNPFCLLLRKHFQSGKIKEISAVENERIIKIVFDSPDELGHIHEKTIYAEIMGKYSNLVCVSNGKVIGSLYAADLISFKRALMPGIDYELPPAQDKIASQNISAEELSRLMSICPDKRCDRFLIDTFFCFSPLSAWETVFDACGNGDALNSEVESESLAKAIQKIHSDIASLNFVPNAVFDGENTVEFFFRPIHRYGNMKNVEYDSLSKLVSEYFGAKAEKNLLKERTGDIAKLVSGRIKRIEKKEFLQKQELIECEKKDEYRINGELITANLYKIRQGDSECVCYDWYTEKDVTVKLDVKMSPSKYAEKLFKKYQKLKNAEKAIKLQLEQDERERKYLESVMDAIDRCENAEEVEQIKDELTNEGYIRKSSKKIQRKPCRPLEFTTSGGFQVRVGRNNIMNDQLTKSADKNDLWFHVKGFSGSHVIMYTNGVEPGDADYTEAAELAAYHSSVRGSENVEVDYTRVRYVHKPAGSKPGFVTYDKYYTAIVTSK